MLYQTQNPHGGDIYQNNITLDYSANTNPFGTPQKVIDAMQNALGEVHHYPDPYCRKLVSAIANFENLPKDYILCGNGAADLIYAYCDALKPKTALELAPTFSEYSLALNRLDCKISRFTLTPKDNFKLNDAFLNTLKSQKPDILFLCNPNNPTGTLIDIDLLNDILKQCQAQNTHLFLDECFFDLTDDGISLKSKLAQYNHLFILKAFTKSYGMAGIRLGYGLSSNQDLLKKMSTLTQPWNISTIAQTAGVSALKEKDFLAKTKNLIKTERAWLNDELKNMGFWVCESSANYILFKATQNLHTQLLKRGIAIRNCDNYHGLKQGWYRIAVRKRKENETLIREIKSTL